MILGGIDLSTYGIIPIQNGNGNIALQGCFDMPARIGKTYHEWQDENGIEPYVRSDEIRFGGRDIKLTALMAHEFENDLLRRLYQFYDAIQFNSLITLETDYGNYDVYLKDEIKAEYYNRGLAKIEILFRQPSVSIVGNIPASDGTLYGIDGISFQTLGLNILEIDGRYNLPATKSQQFTAYSSEGYQITKRTFREITLKCLIVESDLNAFQTRINSLSKLFAKEGLRTITYRHDALRTFFVKDGFQVTDVYITPSEVFGLLTVRCVQVGSNLDWNFLQNHAGVNILTNTGQPITIDQENGYRDYNYLYTNANQLLTNSNGMKIKINEL